MATTKKSPTARVAAGFGAVALATLTAFGAALPASAADSNINPDTDRSLTIHKFEEPATATGSSANGTRITDPSALAGLTPIHGVEFTMQQVPGIDLTDPADWQAASAMPVADAISAVATGSPYERTGTTDATGQLTFDDAVPMGLFLVTETAPGVDADGNPNVIAFETQPFLVTLPLPVQNQWIYEAHVYPKNATTAISKIVDDSDAHVLGDSVSWSITAEVPEIAASNSLDSFIIGDDLAAGLELESTTVSANNVTLVEDVDYRVDVTGQSVRVVFEAAGLTKLAGGSDVEITVEIVTSIIAIGDGALQNSANLWINDPTMPIASAYTTTPATTNWGTLSILKYEGSDQAAVLADAEFQIFRSQADADARTNPVSVLVDGVSVDTFTTEDDGIAFVPGLKAGDTYYVVETLAPIGYQLDQRVQSHTIVAGDIDRTSVDVSLSNAQVPGYALPVTGGDGQAAFMIGGAGLLLGALGFMLIRRRKAAKAQA
ncbi:SpaH/EbpB family LPXTG-anchored major pilin [Agrococcus baldri]|uniref:LPXTG-motif cell wall anchor domain-containing protein/fimbrial isopeptide formation D2 domain-containing protein n=1 Tax=Agrococcus baldri TaxID=153730 RepID=A0AA87URU6_9MICO|nr:SpaH/EbpB family LPXTG-anchored major pilin [Agrococcus baldri]GEK80233.1 hypothetical protein ABA31_15840 [Agrococcus baldri]